MANVQRTSRCRICDLSLASGRLKRFPNAVLCGSLACHVAHQKRRHNHAQQNWRLARGEPGYQPPIPGSIDSADPHFKSKVRPCGRCGEEFRTCVRWRYFCERCRDSKLIKTPPTDRTYAFSSGRRSGGG